MKEENHQPLLEYDLNALKAPFGEFFDSFFGKTKVFYINQITDADSFLKMIDFVLEEKAKPLFITDHKRILKSSYLVYILSKLKQKLKEHERDHSDVEEIVKAFFEYGLWLLLVVAYIKENKLQTKLNDSKKALNTLKTIVDSFFAIDYDVFIDQAEQLFNSNKNDVDFFIYSHRVKSVMKPIYEDKHVTIYRINNYPECRAVGADTNWCTSSSSGAASVENYLQWANLYTLIYNDEKYHLAISKYLNIFEGKNALDEICALNKLFFRDTVSYSQLLKMNFNEMSGFGSFVYGKVGDMDVFSEKNSFEILVKIIQLLKKDLPTPIIAAIEHGDSDAFNKVKINAFKSIMVEFKNSKNKAVDYKKFFRVNKIGETKDPAFNLFKEIISNEPLGQFHISAETYKKVIFEIIPKMYEMFKYSSANIESFHRDKTKEFYAYVEKYVKNAEFRELENLIYQLNNTKRVADLIRIFNQMFEVDEVIRNIVDKMFDFILKKMIPLNLELVSVQSDFFDKMIQNAKEDNTPILRVYYEKCKEIVDSVKSDSPVTLMNQQDVQAEGETRKAYMYKINNLSWFEERININDSFKKDNWNYYFSVILGKKEKNISIFFERASKTFPSARSGEELFKRIYGLHILGEITRLFLDSFFMTAIKKDFSLYKNDIIAYYDHLVEFLKNADIKEVSDRIVEKIDGEGPFYNRVPYFFRVLERELFGKPIDRNNNQQYYILFNTLLHTLNSSLSFYIMPPIDTVVDNFFFQADYDINMTKKFKKMPEYLHEFYRNSLGIVADAYFHFLLYIEKRIDIKSENIMDYLIKNGESIVNEYFSSKKDRKEFYMSAVASFLSDINIILADLKKFAPYISEFKEKYKIHGLYELFQFSIFQALKDEKPNLYKKLQDLMVAVVEKISASFLNNLISEIQWMYNNSDDYFMGWFINKANEINSRRKNENRFAGI
ncbi:MAG: hypothetical protein N3A54_00810 [Patescibacteria group bacterium]|nr:hypothetical protein [Patescibacteria group bacterium]